MRTTVEEREIDGCTATYVFDTGGPVGSEHLMRVEPEEDNDGDWVVSRWFYFDEEVEQYAWNFANKVATDHEYREKSVNGEAEWKQVAELYETYATQLYDVLADAEETDFPIMGDGTREDKEQLEQACEELFNEIKSIVRKGKDRNQKAVFEEQKQHLEHWLQSPPESKQ